MEPVKPDRDRDGEDAFWRKLTPAARGPPRRRVVLERRLSLVPFGERDTDRAASSAQGAQLRW
jgi:hypothetical protein